FAVLLVFVFHVFFFFFFFFQAEDGIRYFHVTGVQTCALPISSSPRRSASAARSSPSPRSPSSVSGFRRTCRPGDVCCTTLRTSRSEERRVGKECRSRWSR